MYTAKPRLLLLVLFLSMLGLAFTPNLYAKEKKASKETKSPISKAQMLAVFKAGEYVTNSIISGKDIITIIQDSSVSIKIRNSIINGGLDFTEAPTSSIETVKLPDSWSALKAEKWRQQKRYSSRAYNKYVHVINNKIHIVNSLIQSIKKPEKPRSRAINIDKAIFFNKVSFIKTMFNGKASFTNSTFDEEVNFNNSIFNNHTKLYNTTFNNKIVFSNASFIEEINFSGSTFIKDATFVGSSFSDTADFRNVTFGQGANFERVKFTKEVEFIGASFNSLAKFRGATFNQPASFFNVSFNRASQFDKATFKQAASFNSSTFKQYANFNSISFKKTVNFSNTTFNKDANFRATTFEDKTFFNNTTFSKRANFRDTTFKDKTDFNRSTFSGSVNFRESFFHRAIYFSRVTFKQSANFIGVTFSGKANFNSAVFNQEADFTSTTFNMTANFQDATFIQIANFDSASFNKLAYFRRSTFFNRLHLNLATFETYADFRGAEIRMLEFNNAKSPIIINGHVDFRGAKIADAHFQNISFVKDVNFSDVAFGSNSDENKPGINKATQQSTPIFATVFRFVTFEKDAYFVRSLFSGALELEQLNFKKNTDFTNANLKGKSKKDPLIFSFSYIDFNKLRIRWDQLPDISLWITKDSERIKSFVDRGEDKKVLEQVQTKKQIQEKILLLTKKQTDTKKQIPLLTQEISQRKAHRQRLKQKQRQLKSLEQKLIQKQRVVKETKVALKNSQLRLQQQVPIQMSATSTNLQPLSQVLKSLETNFRSLKQLSDSNDAFYHMKRAELAEVKGKPLLQQLPVKAEWAFWGIICGYGTKIDLVLGWALLINLMFTFIYSCKGRLERQPHPETEQEFTFKMRVLDFPKNYFSNGVEKRDTTGTADEQAKKENPVLRQFINALRFSTVILFKVGYRDTTVSGHIGKINLKTIVMIEWALGFYLLAALVVTLANTQPLINRLITGVL